MNLDGSIDLNSFPGLRSAITLHDMDDDGMDDYGMDDYHADDYIDDIPNVRSFGTKRCRTQADTEPPMVQAIVPWTGDTDLQEPSSKCLELSAPEKPGTSIVLIRKAKMEVMECAEVTDWETQLKLYESLQKVVVDQKLECANVAEAFREDIAQKESLITTLQTEIGALKDELIFKESQDSEEQVRRHNKEIADVRDQVSREKEELTMKSRNEIRDLKDSGESLVTTLQNEVGALKDELLKQSRDSEELIRRHTREIADVRDQVLREKEELTMKSRNEIRDLKDSEERLVTSLQNEIGALKGELLKQSRDSEELIRRHNREIADVRDQALREKEELMMTSQREIQDLKNSVREETQRHERETEALKVSSLDQKERHSRYSDDSKALLEERESHERQSKDLNALLDEIERHDRKSKDFKALLDEKEGLIARYKRQTEESKAAFLLEKAVIEDRHTQDMASYTSEIINVVLRRSTKHHEAQSSEVQRSSKVGTSGNLGNHY